MKNLIKIIQLSFGLAMWGSAQIVADFRTSEGDFSVALDFENAPLACANFIHLAGKGDDIFETRDGVPFLTDATHNRHLYIPTAESDAERLTLRVESIAATETMRAFYGVFQSDTYIGGVEIFQDANYHADITGQDRIRLSLENPNPARYRITLRYPRPWVDARDQKLKTTPMYRDLVINRVVTGKRFYAGSMTRDLNEHPGYHFQDEVLRTPGNLTNPFGAPFNTGWILAMDTVLPNQNGSRFFITLGADPSLNGRYTAFGEVLQNIGRNVVQDIVNASTSTEVGEEELPNQTMTIYDITFRRAGTAAAAFFEGFEQTFMPGKIEELCLSIDRNGSEYSRVTPLRASSQIILYSSTDLVNFEGGFIDAQSPFQLTPVATDLTPLVNFFPKLFLKGFATAVPSWPSAEVDLAGARFGFKVTSGTDVGTLSLFLDEVLIVNENDLTEAVVTTGTYSLDMEIEQTILEEDSVFVSAEGEGTFTVSYDFGTGPYKGVLNFSNVTGPLNIDQLTLYLDSSRFANTPGVDDSAIIRRFDARTTDPEKDFLSYSGVYQKLE